MLLVLVVYFSECFSHVHTCICMQEHFRLSFCETAQANQCMQCRTHAVQYCCMCNTLKVHSHAMCTREIMNAYANIWLCSHTVITPAPYYHTLVSQARCSCNEIRGRYSGRTFYGRTRVLDPPIKTLLSIMPLISSYERLARETNHTQHKHLMSHIE